MGPSAKDQQIIIKRYILESIASRRALNSSTDLTVGVEHEFFLFSNNGKPASLEHSQAFLHNLSRLPGWRVYSSKSDQPGEQLITRVAKDSTGKYTSVKYEFPPHMLEVAFSYHSNLVNLENEITTTWSSLKKAAELSQTQLLSTPMIEPPAISDLIQAKIDKKLLDLANSRRRLIKGKSGVTSKDADFPSYIAATQIQIGGLNWWQAPRLVELLYLSEPALQAFSYRLLTDNIASARNLFEQRWTAYSRVFAPMRLLGFPNISTWTLDDWIKDLCESPISGPIDDPITEKKTSEANKNGSIEQSVSRLRDLQIIRPKLIGTLEFRADPAMATPEDIIRLAALRFGQCLAIRDNKPLSYAPNLDIAHQQWWAAGKLMRFSSTKEVNSVQVIRDIFLNRSRGEELYLGPLKDCA